MTRRKFSNDYKAEAVKLVLEQGLSISRAAQDLGIGETTLHTWLSKARAGVLDPASPKSQDIEEIKRLRREVAVLKQEREILKKATAFFAKMSH